LSTTESQFVREAIERLFHQYANELYRFALHSFGDPSETKDAVQETFVRALGAWTSFRQGSSARTWLYQILRHYLYDLFRRRQVQRAFSFLTAGEPRQGCTFIDSTMELRDAIASLPVTYRQVLTLRFVQDLTVSEVADILGWSESKVRLTQHRATKKLRVLLDETESRNSKQQRKRGEAGGT